MAIFSPSESPAIVVKEIDLTGVVPNVQSTTGAIVGNYRWGPVREATRVSTETELAAKFDPQARRGQVCTLTLSASYSHGADRR